MSECAFHLGDRVEVADICGTVTEKYKLGGGWMLRVKFDSGEERAMPCSSVSACKADRTCGALKRRGGL